MKRIILKPGKEKKIKHFYPWVFRDEILSQEGEGVIASLYSSDGEFLAKGTYSPHSRIAFRVLSYEDEPIDEGFFRKRFSQALALREGIPSDAYRLAFSESDLLSGLIVDRYAEGFVIQVRSYPMEVLKERVLSALSDFSPRFIYERSDFKGRSEEGLEPFSGLLMGELENPVLIHEREFKFLVDVKGGLKTGFYLDQRDNRAYVAGLLRGGERVLDLFCYTGGFSVYCASRGARVVGVDVNESALELARQNVRLNNLSAEFVRANAFDFLESTNETYDLIIADPPAIAKTKREKESVLWAIWKLAHRSFLKLKRFGRLFICSCTYQISAQEMIRQVRLASTDVRRRILIKEVNLQPQDHPFVPTFPESLYLKCLDAVVID
ncbi:MAG: class I SAM-dependent rRNA methyltransferase [Aquificae bacterium]|nr:class I SAM-dependent rRNA methyltransferase [Aquificota bacterium]